MLFNATSAVRAIERVNTLLTSVNWSQAEDPFPDLHESGFLSELQSFIIHAGALLRYFWPTQSNRRWRGIQLRNAFRISDRNCLRNRDLRNAIEHFDERLDDYVGNIIPGCVLPEYIGPTLEPNNVPTHVFRAYYVDTGRFQLLGMTFDLQPIAGEVFAVHSRLLQMGQQGDRFA
jgi:hypothetical protein